MKYRPDIDGLRAIAVILVLIYHGGLSFFPSGFIGVDVFFVISGFLITSIIHESINTGSFSFLDFYNRRLWRLQPVFICLLFVTTTLTLLFFLPDDLMQFSKSARKSSLFLSNLFFNKTTSGYFSPDTHQLPLLHTWSLSIEWQCYLLLPCLIYGLSRFLPKKYVSASVYVLTLIAFLNSLHNAQTVHGQTYYLLSSRIFEFLMGSCIALIPAITLKINPYFLNIIGCLALVMLLYMANLSPVLAGYPDEQALVVCLATGVLITLGRFFPQCFSSKLLSVKPIVFIGLLSYSLYIWHWVIFSLLRYQNSEETLAIQLFAYGVTFVLAYLSWRFIEKPAHHLRHTLFRYTFVLLVFIPILATHVTSYLIQLNNGFPKRFDGELASVYQQLEHYESKLRPVCIGEKHKEINMQCLVGSKKSNSKKAFMIGDSFSNHYWGFMDVLGQDADVTILMQGVSSCITLPGIYLYDWWHFKNQVYQTCYDLTQKYYQIIQNNHYDYVIIGQLWGNYLSDNIINHLGDKRSILLSKKRLEEALDKALELITTSGAKPVLIKATARMQTNAHDCFFKHIKLRKPYDSAACNFNLPKTDPWMNHVFHKMKRKYPQLITLDPKKVQCIKGTCHAEINGIPVYRDVGHITDYASYQFGTLYLQKGSNPFG